MAKEISGITGEVAVTIGQTENEKVVVKTKIFSPVRDSHINEERAKKYRDAQRAERVVGTKSFVNRFINRGERLVYGPLLLAGCTTVFAGLDARDPSTVAAGLGLMGNGILFKADIKRSTSEREIAETQLEAIRRHRGE